MVKYDFLTADYDYIYRRHNACPYKRIGPAGESYMEIILWWCCQWNFRLCKTFVMSFSSSYRNYSQGPLSWQNTFWTKIHWLSSLCYDNIFGPTQFRLPSKEEDCWNRFFLKEEAIVEFLVVLLHHWNSNRAPVYWSFHVSRSICR